VPAAFFAAWVAICAIPARGWTPPENLSQQPAGSRAFGPKIGRDPMGNLHLVWAGGIDPSTSWRVWYQMFDGLSWSSPTFLSGPNATRPGIAVDGNGTVHLAYEEPAEQNIWYRKKPAGASWTAPLNLRSGGRSIGPSISVDAVGQQAIVAWHEDYQTGGEWDILANILAGDSWGGVYNASANTALSAEARTAIDLYGNLHVAWHDLGDAQYIRHRRRTASGDWDPVQTLHAASRRCRMNSLHASADGSVHLTYSDDDGTGWEIVYRHCDGGSWSGPANVSDHPGVSDDVESTIWSDALNRLYVVWGDLTDVFYSTAADPAAGWSARETIVGGTYGANAPDIVVDNSLTARVVWQSRPTQPDNWNIYLSSQLAGTPGPTGTLTGEVRDSFDQALASATVSTGNAAGLTNAAGQYSFPVPVGTYTATASRPNFHSQSVPDVLITDGATTVHNFRLAPIPPEPVSDFAAVPDDRRNELTWLNPPSPQFAGIGICFRTDGVFPTGPQDGTVLADVSGNPGASGHYAHTGLANGQTYHYAVFAYDSYSPRSYSTGRHASGTPAGPCDYDRDSDVDQTDWGFFQACLSGAFSPQSDPNCTRMKLDGDDDIDEDDVLLFVLCWSGPASPADPDCLP